jgi:hypothetical protein
MLLQMTLQIYSSAVPGDSLIQLFTEQSNLYTGKMQTNGKCPPNPWTNITTLEKELGKES